MRKLVIGTVILAVTGWFVMSPFLTAWQLRHAIQTGDTATLERRVDWPSVRASLRQSYDEVHRAIVELSDAAGVPKPGLWQRIVAATVPMLSGTAIDRYVTPQGVPQLYKWRKVWHEKVRPSLHRSSPPALAATALAGTGLDRVVTTLRRVDRAAFTSPMRVELEMRDHYFEDRHYRAVLELRGLTWKLTEVHLLPRLVCPPSASCAAPAS